MSPDYLLAENAMLKGLLTACSSHLPSEWELTPSESKIVGAMVMGRVISTEQMLGLLYWDRRDEPDWGDNVVKVHLCHIRRKLKRFGIELVCKWGVGYHLDPSGKQIVMRYI